MCIILVITAIQDVVFAIEAGGWNDVYVVLVNAWVLHSDRGNHGVFRARSIVVTDLEGRSHGHFLLSRSIIVRVRWRESINDGADGEFGSS
jgi:hypothetical protein